MKKATVEERTRDARDTLARALEDTGISQARVAEEVGMQRQYVNAAIKNAVGWRGCEGRLWAAARTIAGRDAEAHEKAAAACRKLAVSEEAPHAG